MQSADSLRVLIADFDLSSKLADEAVMYRGLFRAFPQIQFTYLRDQEPAESNLFANVETIRCEQTANGLSACLTGDSFWSASYQAAEKIALAVGSREYDVLEIPDYRTPLSLLPWALKDHGTRVGKVVASLHRRCSQVVQHGWIRTDESRAYQQQLKECERWLVRSAGLRYGFSRNHLDDWTADAAVTSSYISPLSVIDWLTLIDSQGTGSPPRVAFVGSIERYQGVDRFLDFIWQLPGRSFSGIEIHQLSMADDKDVAANELVTQIARSREMMIHLASANGRDDVRGAQQQVVISTPWYDPGNWSVLAAMLAGRPTVLGSGAVARLLQDEFPSLGYVAFENADSQKTVRETLELLKCYGDACQQQRKSLEEFRSRQPRDAIASPYVKGAQTDDEAQQYLEGQYRTQRSKLRGKQVGIVKRTVHSIAGDLSPRSIGKILRDRKLTWVVAAMNWNRMGRMLVDPSTPVANVRERIAELELATGGERFGRAAIWNQLSRLEHQAGRELVGATYALRTMRLTGQSTDEQRSTTISTLEKQGFQQEAELVGLMYGPASSEQRHTRLLKWLDEHRSRHRENASVKFARLDDRRGTTMPRAAIIVSLYKAASKTRFFLDAIQRQTMVRRGEAEVILIDSGSPEDEYSPIADHPCFLESPCVYARTESRETIQQAWNRGLSLARAPYVTMLGADETIRPECLDQLAAELDRRPELDWIQANSLVTETDPHGHYDRDLFLYDRQDYRPELVRLETCYLSWVGALYRRNIHERFGYYDPTFGAAGDTEFKNRLLPSLQTDSYKHTLGVFWNYPEIRTTQHPRAEIEDYRAWHVYRTSAGVEYAHQQSSPQSIVQAAGDALGYRRSYADSQSTDLEYACELLRYATRRDPNCFPSPLLRRMEQTLEDFRTLDRAPWSSSASTLWNSRIIFSRMKLLNSELAQFFPSRPQLTYFNDERCEHINWCWSYLL